MLSRRAAAQMLVPGSLAAPCFAAVREAAARLPSLNAGVPAWPAVAEIDAALAPLARVRFVAGEKVRRRRRRDRPVDAAELYEIRAATRREVTTRPHSAHDLLNALAWAAFPAAKWALIGRLADAQRERLDAEPSSWRLPGRRTRAHDRLALLDEGGILVATGSPAPAGNTPPSAALAAGSARALVFGHALLEHALADRFDVWGAALLFPVDTTGTDAHFRARLDAALSAALIDGTFLAHPWPRLPLRSLCA